MTQLIEAPGREARAWWVAGAAALAIVAAGAFSTMSGLLVEPLHREFGWSHGTIGFAVSVNMVLYGLTAPFAAALMDRFGLRRVVASALITIAVGAALTTVLTAPWQLVLCWGLLVGLGTGAMAMTFAATVTQRWFVARRGLVTGALSAASVFGQFAFLPVLSWLVDHFAWRPGTISLSLTALAVVPLAWLVLRDHPADIGTKPLGANTFVPKPRPERGTATRALRVLLTASRTPPFWLLALTFAVCGASTNGIMWTHFASAAHDHGMPMTAAASLLALIGIFNVAGTLGSGWLTDRFDPRHLLACYYALRGVSLMILPFLMGPSVHAPIIAFVVIFGVLDVATVPPTIALCREFYGDDGAIVFGWVSSAHQVGAGLVAFLGGVVRDAAGSYDPVWFAAGTLCVAAATLALLLSHPHR